MLDYKNQALSVFGADCTSAIEEIRIKPELRSNSAYSVVIVLRGISNTRAIGKLLEA